MVSGSDVHGTPITVRAEAEGVAPDVIVDRYHSEILGPTDGWRRAELEVGRPIDKPTPLFQKIDVEADAD